MLSCWATCEQRRAFRRRLAEWDENALERIRDLVVVYGSLGDGGEFAGLESSHREGVEYLVQVGIYEFGASLKPSIRIISEVRTNPTVHLPAVMSPADRVLSCIREGYPEIFSA